MDKDVLLKKSLDTIVRLKSIIKQQNGGVKQSPDIGIIGMACQVPKAENLKVPSIAG